MPRQRKAARVAGNSQLDALFNQMRQPVGKQFKGRTKTRPNEDRLGLVGSTANLAFAQDFFSNPAARTGFGTTSLENFTEYPLVRWTLNFWEVVSFFESSWIARRIVEAPAQDIVKTWPKVTSDIDPEDLSRLDRAIRRTATKDKVLDTVIPARLFGGAGALIAVEGQDHELDTPLDLKSVPLGGYKGLIPFDRWSGISPTGDVCDDINRPLDFGKPEFYEVRVKGGESFKVHSSRILRFTGPKVPEPENSAYQDWGISVLAPVIQTIKAYDSVSSNALSLTYRANILGMRVPELEQMLSGLGVNQKTAQNFERRMQKLNEMLDNQSLVLLGKEGELSQTQYSFAGLGEMMQMWQLGVSGAAKMPVTRLWGRTFSGLGQAGDGDERIYEETISTESDVTLRPALEKLYPVICMSELGEVPDDFNLNFPSIRVLDEKEKAELAKTVVDTCVVALNAGGISIRTFAQELKQSSTKTDIFTNITDENIEALSDKVQQEGEMGEDLFGASEGGLSPSSSPDKALHALAEERKDRETPTAEAAGAPEGLKPPPKGAVEAHDEVPEGLKPGDRLHIHGKWLTVSEVVVGTKDLFGNPTVQVHFETGEIIPYQVKARTQDTKPYTPEKIRELATKPIQGKVQSRVVQNRIIRDLAEQGYFYWVAEAEAAKELGKQSDVVAAEREISKYRTLLNSAGAKDADGPEAEELNIHGLPVVIETHKGETRSGPGWSNVLPYDYGFIRGYQGADGDSLDAAVGPNPESKWIYVFDQKQIDSQKFDESKCFFGYDSLGDAVKAFNIGHDKACLVYRDVTPMQIDDFKHWINTADLTRPAGAVKR